VCVAMEASKYSAPVGELVGLDWGVLPVKNTFINFNFTTPLPAARHRSVTCPCSSSHRAWENAMQEICHAMPPASGEVVRPLVAAAEVAEVGPRGPPARGGRGFGGGSGGPRSGSASRQTAAATRCAAAAESEADKISEVSTTSSERGNSETAKDEASPPTRWSAVPTRGQRRTNASQPSESPSQPSLPSASISKAGSPVAAATPQAASPQAYGKGGGKGSGNGKGKGAYDSPSPNSDGSPGKGEGKGKGLQHFRKIEVGIPDDPNFRVVQRLIGPKGKHMQDILTKSKGAKIWIIGKGSRSWEDDVGPLVVCVGATSNTAFENAVVAVKDLLARVAEDHRKFRR